MSSDDDEQRRADAETARIILSEARAKTIEILPKHIREAYQAKRSATRAKSEANVAARADRLKRVLELILSGYSQEEAARNVRLSDSTVSYHLKPIWPFARPGADHRYLLVQMSPSNLGELDLLCADGLLPRARMVEEILKANLADGAFRARQTLHITRKQTT